MDKSQAIHSFWSGFGLTAYDENSVPDGTAMPYITYSVTTDAIENTAMLTGSLWYWSSSWEDISKKADDISMALKDGVVIELDRGYAYLYRGTPFAQRMSDEADDMVKRIYFNVNCEYLTNY